MSDLIKILVISLCMNIMMTLVGVSVGGYDVLNKFVTINGDVVTPSSEFSLTNNASILPTDPNSAIGSVTNVDNGSFIDTLRLVFGFLLMILVGLFFPLYWGFALNLPLWLSLILTLQTIVGVTALVLAIRGVSS